MTEKLLKAMLNQNKFYLKYLWFQAHEEAVQLLKSLGAKDSDNAADRWYVTRV